MNKLTVLICFFFATTCFAQKYPDGGLNQVRLNLPGFAIVATLDPIGSNPKVKAGLSYYWYSANEIHCTQSGYSGKLLNGLYTEYYKNKNLKSLGSFKKGLKDGCWKTWNEDGTLSSQVEWKKGRELINNTRQWWRKFLFFKKRKTAENDSLKKSTK